MDSRQLISDFLAQRTLALVGISRSGKGFGNAIFKDLKTKGYKVYPVHPKGEDSLGQACPRNLAELPEKVGGVVLVIPPTETEKVVREVGQAGIRRVWMQQGSESEEAIRYCEQNGISVVHGNCILMFAEPAAFIHRLHRWIAEHFFAKKE
jgi:predicted CoA-binding protein